MNHCANSSRPHTAPCLPNPFPANCFHAQNRGTHSMPELVRSIARPLARPLPLAQLVQPLLRFPAKRLQYLHRSPRHTPSREHWRLRSRLFRLGFRRAPSRRRHSHPHDAHRLLRRAPQSPRPLASPQASPPRLFRLASTAANSQRAPHRKRAASSFLTHLCIALTRRSRPLPPKRRLLVWWPPACRGQGLIPAPLLRLPCSAGFSP